MLDIKYVEGDDQAGLYINGNLKCEGHRIRINEGIETIRDYVNDFSVNLNLINFTSYEVDQDWLEGRGDLPSKFDSIPKGMLVEE